MKKTDQDINLCQLADEVWNLNFKKKIEIVVTSQRPWEWGPKNQYQDSVTLGKMLVCASENNANLLLNFASHIRK